MKSPVKPWKSRKRSRVLPFPRPETIPFPDVRDADEFELQFPAYDLCVSVRIIYPGKTVRHRPDETTIGYDAFDRLILAGHSRIGDFPIQNLPIR